MSNPLILQLASLQDISRSLRKELPPEGVELIKKEFDNVVYQIDKNGGSILLMTMAFFIKRKIMRREKQLNKIHAL